MTDDFEARVREIRARAEARPLLSFGGVDQPENGPVARQRVQACFADRWRLLAFVEAALPILRAVAEGRARPGFGVCQHCGAYRLMDEHPRTHAWVVTDDYDHTNDCPVTASRALLAGTMGAEGSG